MYSLLITIFIQHGHWQYVPFIIIIPTKCICRGRYECVCTRVCMCENERVRVHVRFSWMWRWGEKSIFWCTFKLTLSSIDMHTCVCTHTTQTFPAINSLPLFHYFSSSCDMHQLLYKKIGCCLMKWEKF